MNDIMNSTTMENPLLTILGAGYVGQALLRRFPAATATRRQALPPGQTFDLRDTATWGNPPLANRMVVWTFPAEPLTLVQAFFAAQLRDAASIIVLGSTSAYRVAETPGQPAVTVNEESPLELDQPRVQGEEWLRERGATVLQLAGIFGPGRDPAGWLRKGLVRDGAKLVNLIHVDDIVALIAYLLTHPRPGTRVNVANGKSPAWRELAAHFRADGRLPADFTLPESGPREYGKRIDNRVLRSLLPERRFLQP